MEYSRTVKRNELRLSETMKPALNNIFGENNHVSEYSMYHDGICMKKTTIKQWYIFAMGS